MSGKVFLHTLVRIFVWAVLVAGLAAALVGGVVYYLYATTDEGSLPSYAVSFAGQPLAPCGYEWTLPVLGDGLTRRLAAAPTADLQQLQPVETAHPAIEAPAGTGCELVIENEDGLVVFEGNLDDYAGFALPCTGDYAAQLTVHSAPHAGGAVGRYLYRFAFALRAQPVLQLSAARATVGNVVGVRLSGSFCSTPPQLETTLCTGATFVADGDDWVAYLPVPLGIWAGEHTVSAWANGTATTATIDIYARSTTAKRAARSALPYLETPNTALAAVLEICDPERYWGTFAQPVGGKVLRDFGATDTAKMQSSHIAFGVAYGKTVTAPAAGRVVLAENLGRQCGNTLVIEHGCGLKSIFYRMARIDAAEGSYLALGDAVGSSGAQIVCEMRLHGVPISPWSVWRGQGGLFWAGEP